MPTHSDPQVSHLQPRKPENRGDSLRLRANCASAVAVLALLLIGGWAENGLVNALHNGHDCYRPGSSSCAAIYIPAPPPSIMRGS
jgi:hypothetical protein